MTRDKSNGTVNASAGRMTQNVPHVDLDQTLARQLAVQMLDNRTLPVKESRQASGRDDRHGSAILRFDPCDQALDQPDIAPIESRLHGRNRVLADDSLRP